MWGICRGSGVRGYRVRHEVRWGGGGICRGSGVRGYRVRHEVRWGGSVGGQV